MRIKFIQNLIDKLRNKNKKTGNNVQNNIEKFCDDNIIELSDKVTSDRLSLNIGGKGNKIKIGKCNFGKNSRIAIELYGDNNIIEIKDGFSLSGILSVEMGRNHPIYGKIENSKIIIEEGTSVESCVITTIHSETYIEVGKNCMFASDINLYNTDSHPVFDFETKKVINKVRGIKIGEHCWLGKNVTILKNTEIANDCIIGWGAVVSGKYTEEHCAIAGNPAKVVKKSITWSTNAENFVSQKDEDYDDAR